MTAGRPLAIALALLLAGCADHTEVRLAGASGLYVDCRGKPSAAPTVILEAGAFGASTDWDLVLGDLAKGGRACAYDRGGVGRSPGRAGGADTVAIANELSELLDQLGERRPVILVGHSNGALYAETFAALWPHNVAGLVYVQGVTSDDLDHPELIADLSQERRLADLAAAAGDMGLGSAVSGILADQIGFTGPAAKRKQLDMADPAALHVARDEDRAVIDGLAAARKLGGSPPAIPTAVITGSTEPGSALYQAWRAAETAPAARAKRSWVLEIPGATHTSPLARDRAYVVAAVNWLRAMPQTSISP